MKKSVIMLTLSMLTFVAFGQDINPEDETSKSVIAVVAVAVYEVLARIIPTVKDYTIVGKAIRWLGKLSDLLNIKITKR